LRDVMVSLPQFTSGLPGAQSREQPRQHGP
jgi:hypothetical protein